jgi:hypothetical protein
VKAIQDFLEVYNENAEPFVWRKREVKGSQLKNSIKNFELCNWPLEGGTSLASISRLNVNDRFKG